MDYDHKLKKKLNTKANYSFTKLLYKKYSFTNKYYGDFSKKYKTKPLIFRKNPNKRKIKQIFLFLCKFGQTSTRYLIQIAQTYTF